MIEFRSRYSSHGRNHIGGDALILEEAFMAGVAIGHMNLQQCPFFLRDFAGVVESTKSDKLVMELRIQIGSRAREHFVPILSLKRLFRERGLSAASAVPDRSGVSHFRGPDWSFPQFLPDYTPQRNEVIQCAA